MAAHARLKNEFTEDKKYHNLVSQLISGVFIPYAHNKDTVQLQSDQHLCCSLHVV